MEREKQERNEEWFASEVCLPNWGLDPSRDCNHVEDSELERMFGERQMQKGYFYPNAKSTRVRKRVDELFCAVYQCSVMPKHQCISESFARAIVSEVCHGYPLNWAQYAEERWRARKSGKKKDTPVIKYGAEEMKDSYYGLVKARFETELAKLELLHSEVEADYSDRHIFISSLMSKPRNPACGAEADQVKKIISRLRKKLHASEDALKNLGDSEDEQEKKRAQDRIVLLKYRLKKKEIALKDTKGEIIEAMEELKRLEAVMKDLQDKSDRLRVKLKKMTKLLSFPLTLHTSYHIEGDQSGRSTFQVKVNKCALCDSTFTRMDIIVAPCHCTYHPWCVVMQCMLAEECADRECREQFTENWKKSLGLDKLPEYDLDKPQRENQQPRRKRKHTNSDIGGVSFSKKKKR
ncbi:hypothetical protein M758_1G295500 [Ceratodon purpureus]|nr:hypothetical protein M758_1G295500 [Ceratodon purpureus]